MPRFVVQPPVMTRPLLWGTCAFALALATTVASSAWQAPPGQTPSSTAPKPDEEEGFAITNPTVIKACASCHAQDSKQRLSRISYRRTTPEGWQETIRRMVSLNKADIDPADARAIVKYLSDAQGLAPEEVAPATFELERRLIDFKYTAHAETERVCASCHSMGRVMLQRRSSQEWNLVAAMHRGWYPLIDFQVFRRGGPASSEPGPDGRPPDNRHPYEKAVSHLRSAYPLTTPAWTEWSATQRSPRLAGTWVIKGYDPGRGAFFGQMTVTANAAAEDEFTTEATYTYSKDGRSVTRRGRSLVYTGFQWRGRSTAGTDDTTTLREVMHVDRGWQRMTGRWFAGGYDEVGVDVTLTRVDRNPVVSGLDRLAVPVSSTGTELRIHGANLPTSPSPADVDFGRGVTVARVVSATPSVLTVQINVAADATVGQRDLVLGGVVTPKALAVYGKLDYIKVGPTWNMSRVGGVVFPKMFAQFEALAFSNGPDGKPDSADDIAIGAVDATWSLEEYTATYDDDDIKFVGEIGANTGYFTPALDGPNPNRSGNRNNVGDVWVVAAHTPAGASAPMRARAHLVVTVPLYMRWDFSTVGGR